jgi:hypothetical protein
MEQFLCQCIENVAVESVYLLLSGYISCLKKSLFLLKKDKKTYFVILTR